jgi:hypothetical protein
VLKDPDVLVRQAARRSLVVLSYYVDAAQKAKQKNAKPKAVDFGPKPTATNYGIKDSAKKWKDWVAKHEKDLQNLPNASKTSNQTAEK